MQQHPSIVSSPTGPSAAEFRCKQCEYDLSGTTVGGVCPECGFAVADSLRPHQIPLSHCADAGKSLVFGILSIFCLGFILAPVAIYFGSRALLQIREGGFTPASRGMAIAGITIASLVLAGFALIILFELMTL